MGKDKEKTTEATVKTDIEDKTQVIPNGDLCLLVFNPCSPSFSLKRGGRGCYFNPLSYFLFPLSYFLTQNFRAEPFISDLFSRTKFSI
jgi:hypothetical protein